MNLIEELGFAVMRPIMLYCDNKGAREWALNPMVTNRSKHIDLRYHYVRELVANGTIEVQQIPSAENTADILTKHLGRLKFFQHRGSIVTLH